MKFYDKKIEKMEKLLKLNHSKDNTIATIESFIKLLDTEELINIADNNYELSTKDFEKLIQKHSIENDLKKQLLDLIKCWDNLAL